MALQRVSAEGLTTLVYGVGAWMQGYTAVALLDGLVATAAMAAILRLDGPTAPRVGRAAPARP